jgi:hypothetical protein
MIGEPKGASAGHINSRRGNPRSAGRRGNMGATTSGSETGPRGGKFRIVNGKKVYGPPPTGRVKMSPNAESTSTGGQAAPSAGAKKGFGDHLKGVAKHFIPATASGRASLAGRMLRTVAAGSAVALANLNGKYPGAAGAVKKWVAKKAVETATKYVSGQANSRIAAYSKKKWG